MNKKIFHKKMTNSVHLRETVDGVAEKCINANLRDYQVFGNSIQDGTPTPDNPIEVQSVGEKTVNLFDINTALNGQSITTSNGTDLTNENRTRSAYIKVTAGNYVISGDTSEALGGYFHKYSNESTDNWIGAVALTKAVQDSNGRYYRSGTINEDCYIRFVLLDNKSNVISYNIQLQEGSTPTNYEPYGKYKIPINISSGKQSAFQNIYLDEPLRGIGDYKDYVDFKNQKVCRRVRELVVTGEETWEIILSNEQRVYRLKVSNERLALSSAFESQKCNYYTCCAITTTDLNVGVSVYYSSNLGGTYFRLRDNDSFENATAVKTFCQEKNAEGNPLKVYYQSYDTIEEDIELPALPQFKGTTIYSIPTTVQGELWGKYKTRL